MKYISFLFPIHNEVNRVHHVIKFIDFLEDSPTLNSKYELVFLLNDCSDGTKDRLAEILRGKSFSTIEVASRSRGAGVNEAIRTLKTELCAICAIDSSWGYEFYENSFQLFSSDSNLDIVYGPKNHSASKVKKSVLRKIISAASYLYINALFPRTFEHETQCIKMFRRNLRMCGLLHDYNYFSETEFYILGRRTAAKTASIPVNVTEKKGSKVSLGKIMEFCYEALKFRFFLLRNKQRIEKYQT